MTAMLHRKFSRGEELDDPSITKSIPLMEPLPDKSWEVPHSLIIQPVGVVGCELSTVGGETVEHHQCERVAVNGALHHAVEQTVENARTNHVENSKIVERMRGDVATQNTKIEVALKEFCTGVVDQHDGDMMLADVGEGAGVVTTLSELHRILSKPIVDRSVVGKTLAVLQDGGVSRVVEQECLDLAKSWYEPERKELFKIGGRLVRNDVFQYLKSELKDTEHNSMKLSVASKAILAKKTAIPGDTAKIIEVETQALPLLIERFHVETQRLQCITLSQGEILEYTEECENWRKTMYDVMKTRQEDWAGLKRRLHVDLGRLREAEDNGEAEDAKGKVVYETKVAEGKGLLRDNTNKMEKAFEVVRQKIEELEGLHVERSEIVNTIVKEAEGESARVALRQQWVELSGGLTTMLEEALEREGDVQTKTQLACKEFYETANLCIVEKDVDQALETTKGKEARLSLESYRDLILTLRHLADYYEREAAFLSRTLFQEEVHPPPAPTTTAERLAHYQSLRDTYTSAAAAHIKEFDVTKEALEALDIPYTDPVETADAATLRSRKALASAIASLRDQ